jgi:polar amino acid transport system substrate-binding protein
MRSSLVNLCRGARRTGAAILILTCIGLSLVVSAQTAPLRLVSTPWPPFTNPPGQPRFALDLVEAALSRVGLTANTMMVSPAQFTPSLLSGDFDGSGAAWKDAERDRLLVFSQPYLENRLVLVGRHGADVSAKTLADLTGKRIAIVEGYAYGDAIQNAGPVFVHSRNEEDSVSQLLKETVDYTLIDDLVVNYLLSNYPKESATRLQIGSTPLLTRELHLAISRKRADAESIVAKFNAQLRGMIADRTYHRLLHVDWIRADINGDGTPEYVPSSDRLGPSAPQHVYTLFSTPQVEPKAGQTSTKPGFYLGGNIYSDWASVPDSYKVVNQQPPDARRSTASVFKFAW